MDEKIVAESQSRIERIEGSLRPLTSIGDEGEGLSLSAHLTERMSDLKVPGVGVTVVEDFEPAWSRSYGVREVDSEDRVTHTTPFEIGSTTKLVTAIAALQLVEQGKIGLDDDANDVLVNWKIPDSHSTVDEKVTLRRLLNHTSGIPATNFGWDDGTTPTLKQVLCGAAPARNEKVEVATTPGRDHAYSNLGYVVIQQMVEDVIGKPFQELIQHSLLEPLGMSHSAFDLPGLNDPVCHPHDGEGAAHPISLHPSALAQGGLLSTPEDLAKLAMDLMNGSEGRNSQLLRTNTIQCMMQPDPELDIAKWSGFTDGQGLGLFLLGRGKEMKFLAPGLNLPGATGLIIAWPSRGFAVTLTTNALNGQMLQIEILNSIANEYGFDWGFQMG
jgi:CubicO group peptidase (beta-lactamase class C family)